METEQFTLTTGVVLNLWHGSPLAIDNVVQGMKDTDPQPMPPMVHSEEKDRDEPNENDPEYKKVSLEWTSRIGLRIYAVLLATSSSVQSIPEGMIQPDSDEFIEVLQISGIVPRRTSIGLYVQWMQMIAAGPKDTELLGTKLLRLAGISEGDIAEAQATFRGLPKSDANPDASSDVNGSDRDRVQGATSGIGS